MIGCRSYLLQNNSAVVSPMALFILCSPTYELPIKAPTPPKKSHLKKSTTKNHLNNYCIKENLSFNLETYHSYGELSITQSSKGLAIMHKETGSGITHS